MNISGSNSLIKRSIYPQTGNCSFIFTGNVVNTTGRFKIGFSGNAGDYFILLESGKILDKNNDFLGAYNSFVDFGLKYELSSGAYNVFINETPVKLAAQKPTGVIDYFYTWREDNSEIIFDVSIFGDSKPSLTISEVGYLLNTGQDVVSGLFRNNSIFPIKLFDMESDSVALTLVKPTGQIYSDAYFLYSGDFASASLEYPIETIFYTNYQNYEVDFRIIDLRQSPLYILLNESQINSGENINGQILNNIYYNNYSGDQLFSFNSDFTVSLEYVSGSGLNIDASYTGTTAVIATASGIIIESGNIGFVYMAASGDGSRTGFVVATGEVAQYATGQFSRDYIIRASGIGTGVGYTGLCESYLTGSVNFTIYSGSGTYTFINHQISRPWNSGNSIYYQGYVKATGSINLASAGNTDVIYVGLSGTPIIKSYQYFDASGLAAYLSGAPAHGVTPTLSGDTVLLSYSLADNGNGWLLSGSECNVGTIVLSDNFLTGGSNIGVTGLPVIPNLYQTGYLNAIYTGSGFYTNTASGNYPFNFQYTKEFTGFWSLLTGETEFDLVVINKNQPNIISTTSILKPNSLLSIRVDHASDDANTDYATLRISGSQINNPITINLQA